ncbi:MAG: O-methyltransferase [Myxococcota bacterium]
MADNDSRTGARYANAAILDWAATVHAPHDAALEHAFSAPGRESIPAIQVGPSEGRTLEILMRLVNAKKVVEVGTLAAYSTIWLARGMAVDGKIVTLEADPKHAEISRRNLAEAGLSNRVEVRQGDAQATLAELESWGPVDAVFVDADKENYHAYGRWAARNLRPGGLLVGDNAYLFGNLLEETDRGTAMRTFHEEAAKHFTSVCLPTPDGLVIAIRKP